MWETGCLCLDAGGSNSSSHNEHGKQVSHRTLPETNDPMLRAFLLALPDLQSASPSLTARCRENEQTQNDHKNLRCQMSSAQHGMTCSKPAQPVTELQRVQRHISSAECECGTVQCFTWLLASSADSNQQLQKIAHLGSSLLRSRFEPLETVAGVAAASAC